MAPSPSLNVVRLKLPSSLVSAWAGRPPTSGTNCTAAPATVLPSSVTTPDTFTALSGPWPQPAASSTAAAARPAAAWRIFISGPLSEVADRLAVVAAAEQLVRPVVDRLADEPDRAVAEEEVGPAGVVRLEPERQVPVIDLPARVHAGVPARVQVVGDGVDRDDGRDDRQPAVGLRPAGGPAVGAVLAERPEDVAVLGREDLAQQDRVGQAVRHRGHGDHRASAAEHP